MKLFLFAAVLFAAPVLASQAVQTDWAGGSAGGVVTGSWANCFESSNSTAWMSVSGQIQLSSIPLASSVEHLVFSGIANPYAAGIADLNDDGFNDIVIGAVEAGEVRVFYGSESGSWSSQTVSSASDGCLGIAIADLNGDGTEDIAAACETAGIIQVFYNQGGETPTWVLQDAATGFGGAHDVETADMDGDGDIDLIAAASTGDRVSWFRNEGGANPVWTELTVETGIDYPCKIQALDINLDGNMDILCAAWLEDEVRVWYGSGGSDPVWTAQTLDAANDGAHGARACDVDSDGDIDVFAASLNGSCIYLYRNMGGSPILWNRETAGIISGCAMVRTGDMDGDGDWDVVSSSFGNAGVAWWENTEAGTVFVKHIVKTGGQATSWAMPGDVDNDGDLDVLAVRYQGNAIYWYETMEYVSSGSLESLILDIGEIPLWASIDWNAEVPSGTELGVQFRSSDDSENMGDWSSVYSAPSTLSGLVSRYFQYKLLLNSADPENSPVVRSFQFNWDPMGIEPDKPSLALSFQNPAFGSVLFSVSTAARGRVAFAIYDTLGRRVFFRSSVSDEQFTVSGLPAGVYSGVAIDGSGGRIAESLVILN